MRVQWFISQTLCCKSWYMILRHHIHNLSNKSRDITLYYLKARNRSSFKRFRNRDKQQPNKLTEWHEYAITKQNIEETMSTILISRLTRISSLFFLLFYVAQRHPSSSFLSFFVCNWNNVLSFSWIFWILKA